MSEHLKAARQCTLDAGLRAYHLLAWAEEVEAERGKVSGFVPGGASEREWALSQADEKLRSVTAERDEARAALATAEPDIEAAAAWLYRGVNHTTTPWEVATDECKRAWMAIAADALRAAKVLP